MEVLHLNKNNFKEEVMDYNGKVLIDFWAPWCNPCRMLGPIIEEVELAQMFHVTSIPLVVIMENGKLIKTSLGYKPKDEILELLK